MTDSDYIQLAAYALGFWLTGFASGTLHRLYVQMIEKASLAD